MVFGPAFGGCHGGLEEFLIDPPGVGGSDRARDAGRDPLIESLPDMIGTTTGGPFHSVPWSTRQSSLDNSNTQQLCPTPLRIAAVAMAVSKTWPTKIQA
jgi:hypothetical protein